MINTRFQLNNPKNIKIEHLSQIASFIEDIMDKDFSNSYGEDAEHLLNLNGEYDIYCCFIEDDKLIFSRDIQFDCRKIIPIKDLSENIRQIAEDCNNKGIIFSKEFATKEDISLAKWKKFV